MDPTRTAYGTWSGGRFMHFGAPLDDDRYLGAIRLAYQSGIRTFITADVYGTGQSDEMLGRALVDFPRDSYCLIGAVGHDFYTGKREGSKGYPRFTDSNLRQPAEYGSYLRMATEKSLERMRADKFDLLFLHNPDSIGYTSEAVWQGMQQLKTAGLTDRLGIAPGPANGFTLDIIGCLECFDGLIDWAMIILNPLEPWPGRLCLPAAAKTHTKILTRVVDYGGLFHDDVKPGHQFGPQDHRAFRPSGWVEAGISKIDKMRGIARLHGLTLLQLAAIWNLHHPAVASVVPTLIQEMGEDSRPIENKITELASLPDVQLKEAEYLAIAEIGDNTNCMSLKGGNPAHSGESLPDRWELNPLLNEVARRWQIDPRADLVAHH